MTTATTTTYTKHIIYHYVCLQVVHLRAARDALWVLNIFLFVLWKQYRVYHVKHKTRHSYIASLAESIKRSVIIIIDDDTNDIIEYYFYIIILRTETVRWLNLIGRLAFSKHLLFLCRESVRIRKLALQKKVYYSYRFVFVATTFAYTIKVDEKKVSWVNEFPKTL